MESSAQSRIEMISKINTAIYLGDSDTYQRAVVCIKLLMMQRCEIAKRSIDYKLNDETRELYYKILEEYNENIRKVLGL
jgi:hypothetical protein